MNNRLKLQSKLEEILGSRNVYFQPPASVKLSYPCVVYNIGNGDAKRADDKMYLYMNSYTVTFIYKKPNIDIIERVLNEIPMSSVNATYCSDNLNHYVFTIYY